MLHYQVIQNRSYFQPNPLIIRHCKKEKLRQENPCRSFMRMCGGRFLQRHTILEDRDLVDACLLIVGEFAACHAEDLLGELAYGLVH